MGPMKHYLFLFTLLVSQTSFAADAKKDSAKKGETSGTIAINSSLQKLIDIDGVKPLYEGCEKRSPGVPDTVFKCLWDQVKDDASLKKKVMDAYAQENAPAKDPKKEEATALTDTTSIGRAPASSEGEANLITKKSNININYSVDPAVQALSEFFGKKLDEILDPNKALTKEEVKEGRILEVDHKKFIELYKSELGKTIVNAFTSYCLDTDPTTLKCSPVDKKFDCSKSTATISNDPEKREDHRKKNLDGLKTANLNGDSEESAKWQTCIAKVTPNCKPSGTGSINDETSTRACLVVDFVQAARKNIMIADKQIEDYKLLDSSSTTGIVSNTKGIDDLKKTSSDSILEMTAKDVKDSLKKPMEVATKEFEACYKGGAIVDAEACKKYLSTNTNENSQALVEMQLRQEAQLGTLEDKLKDDEKVRTYLKEEGYSKDDIARMTKDPKAVGEVRDEIIARYKAQKDAIIKEMAAKIERNVATVDGKVSIDKDKSKLDKIKDELESRSKDLQNLVQFNNIVSSYISISDSKGNSAGRNTASLFAEAKSMDKDEAKILNKSIKAAELTDQKGKASSVDLNVKVINDELVDYDFQQKYKEEDKKKK
jgi:hypothetical protein